MYKTIRAINAVTILPHTIHRPRRESNLSRLDIGSDVFFKAEEDTADHPDDEDHPDYDEGSNKDKNQQAIVLLSENFNLRNLLQFLSDPSKSKMKNKKVSKPVWEIYF